MIPDAVLGKLKGLFAPDRFSIGESVCSLHSCDESFHLPCLPEVIVWPQNAAEVQQVLVSAHEARIPVTAWGAGTSLEGNPIPVKGGIVLDFTRMNRILDLRLKDLQVDVEPGLIYQDLNEYCRPHGLFFPPDPGARATVGGMIGNNASGTRTVRYGATRDYVLALEVVMADGSLIETGTRAAKSSSGYHLTHLFVGSEGTLGIVTRATLRLVGFPEHFSAAVASFSTTHQAAEAVHEIIVSGVHPAALELLAPEVIVLLNNERGLNLPEAPALFMEFHNSSEAGLRQDLEMVAGLCRDQGSLQFRSGLGLSERNRLWEARHQTFETIKRAHPAKSFLIADTAVPISRYPEMVEYARQLLINKEQLGYVFGHAGDGNLHLVLVGQRDDPDSWSRVQDVNQTLVNQALALKGTATGEHGIGIGKRIFKEAEHGPALLWMRKIKDLFDPFHILNPGKMLPDH